MVSMTQNQNMIPMFKPYDRMGQFAMDPSSIYLTYEEAKAYALSGKTGGKAHRGQFISVLNEDNADGVDVYVINNDYTLRPINDSIANEENLYAIFDYKTAANPMLGCKLKAGFFLRTVTVTIDKAFNSADSFQIVMSKNGSLTEYDVLFEYDENGLQNILADEQDSIFLLSIGEPITTTTYIYPIVKTGLTQGEATLKIN